MNSNFNLTNCSQWHVYQQLELIPDFVSNPAQPSSIVSTMNRAVWRRFIALLVDELVEEQRVEYLDRCWSINEFGENRLTCSLHQLWMLMN